MTIRELVFKEKYIFEKAVCDSYPAGLLSVLDFVACIKGYIVSENNFYIFFNTDVMVEQELRCCFINDKSSYIGKQITLIPEPNMDKLERNDSPFKNGKLNFIISLDEKCEKPIAAIYAI